MSSFLLWLRVRNLRQFLLVCLTTGLLSAWIGQSVSPVPGQLFADIAGVPLVYFSPIVVAVSLAQWAPTGAYWFEQEPTPARTSATIALGLVLAVVPPLLVSRATEVCLVSARNAVLLAGLALLLRIRWSVAATTAAVLVPNFIVWTFGWTDSGEPHEWALLLAPPSAGVAGAATAASLTVFVNSTRRLRSQ